MANAFLVGSLCALSLACDATAGGELPQVPVGHGQGRELAIALDSPLTMIGIENHLPGHLLHRVVAAVRLSDGRIAIANGGSNQLRIFDTTGALVAEMGGTGGGPEEFASVGAMWLSRGDSIVAFDPLANRASVWSSDGSHGRTRQIPLQSVPQIPGAIGGGAVLTVTNYGVSREERAPGLITTDSMTLGWLNVWTGEFRKYARVVKGHTYLAAAPIINSLVQAPLPAGPTGVSGAGRGRFYYGYSAHNLIRIYDASGDSMGSIRFPHHRRVRTADQIDTWLDRSVGRFPLTQRPAAATYFRRFPQPDSLPYFDEIVPDQHGRVWVRSYLTSVDSVAHWDVIGSTGPVVAYADLPVTFDPLAIGSNWILGRGRDEQDVEYVGLYEIEAVDP